MLILFHNLASALPWHLYQFSSFNSLDAVFSLKIDGRERNLTIDDAAWELGQQTFQQKQLQIKKEKAKITKVFNKKLINATKHPLIHMNNT